MKIWSTTHVRKAISLNKRESGDYGELGVVDAAYSETRCTHAVNVTLGFHTCLKLHRRLFGCWNPN